MSNLALFFAILQGISVGSYTVFMKLGATKINPALGAMIVSIIAFIVNLFVFLGMKIKGQPIIFSTKGLFLLILVGLAAAGIDLFGLLAYSKGFKITSSFLIGGISTAMILFVGFVLLKEPVNFIKLLAIGLILAGTFLLQRFGL